MSASDERTDPRFLRWVAEGRGKPTRLRRGVRVGAVGSGVVGRTRIARERSAAASAARTRLRSALALTCAFAERARRPRLDVLVAELGLRRAALELGQHRVGREAAGGDEEAGVRDHAVVGPHREALHVPAAHHRLGRLRLGVLPGRADRLGDARELGDGRDVAEQHAAGLQRGRDDVDALPRREHVEHDAVDGCRAARLGQRLGQVAERDRPVLGVGAVEGRDVAARDLGELLAALEREEAARRADRAQQPERQRARADAGLDDGGAREDVGLREDLRGILRVDDRGAARHRHDEVAEQRTQGEVLDADLVRRRPSRRAGR